MATQLYRLADAAGEAPYYANLTTFRYFPRHRRLDYLDIVLVVGGEGHHVVHGPDGRRRVYPLVPGRMALYRTTDEITLSGSEPDGVTIRHVAFPVAEWETFSSFVGVDPAWSAPGDPPVVNVDRDDPTVARPFQVALERFWDDPTLLDLVQFWTDVIPLFFPSHARRADGAGAPRWLADAVAGMTDEQNLRGGFTRLVELARVTPSHLAAVTRRYYRRTPTQLVTELRLRHAAVLLSTTTESIGAIAARCGFGSFAHFSAAFRRRHRLTPRDFRARALGHFGRGS
jgi:AraC-like DNA-binding protein